MDNTPSTQEIVTTLIRQAAQSFGQGLSLPQVQALLEQMGANAAVAHAIAIKGQAVYLASIGKL